MAQRIYIHFLLIVFFLKAATVDGQGGSTPMLKKYYIGLGTGQPNTDPAGIFGIRGNIRIRKFTLLDANIGLGGYGQKYSAGVILNAKLKNAFCPLVSMTYNSGISKYSRLVQYLDDQGHTQTGLIDFKLKPVTTFNLGCQYQFISRHKNRFFIELGIAFRMTNRNLPYYEVITQGIELSNEGEKRMKHFRPAGGFIGFGFSFGI